MKKTTLLMICLTALIATTTFSSCEREEDMMRAYTLSGDWTGDFGMYFSDGYYEYDAAYTDIQFVPAYTNASYGTGTQVDYYNRPAPYPYLYYRFDWEIYRGVLRISYPYNHELDVEIYDYQLTDRYFKGRVGNTTFRLYKLRDFYDWHNYNNDYGYGYWDGYYAKTRSGADSTAVATPNLKVGNRFKEGKK